MHGNALSSICASMGARICGAKDARVKVLSVLIMPWVGRNGGHVRNVTAVASRRAATVMRASQRLNDHLEAAICEFTMVLSPQEIYEAKNKMSKMARVAERIHETKKMLDSEADRLAKRLDAIDQATPVAMQNAHAFCDQQHKEVSEIENTLRQLSNSPLGE